MVTFVLRRLLAGAVLMFVVASLTFALLSVSGTDAARNIVGENASPEQAAAKASELGLDRPFFVRYWDWLSSVIQGDLGSSWFSNVPVSQSIADTLPITLSFVIVGLVISTVISVALGSIAAVRGGVLDRSIQVFASLGTAVPSFLIALVLALVVAVQLGWLPATGYVPFAQSPSGWLESVTLPAIALAVGATAATTQQVRGSMRDVLQTDYIRTLRSRGISERSLILKHALRNSLPPSLTVLSLQFIGLLGGAVIVEKIFGLPGIGSLANSSATQGDLPLVLGIVIVMVLMIVVINLVVDVAYGWLNPKVRVS